MFTCFTTELTKNIFWDYTFFSVISPPEQFSWVDFQNSDLVLGHYEQMWQVQKL